MRYASPLLYLLVLAALSACTAQDGAAANRAETFDAIGPGETVRFVGTEPFWGGEAKGTALLYTTPENAEGATIAVERFAGNSGLSFSGRYAGAAFDLMVTTGRCSDGMSDQTFPYHATLKLGEGETRNGCAWTDDQPFEGPAAP